MIDDPSRRTVLGQVGVITAAALGVGAVGANQTSDDADDAIEEIADALVEFESEVENAQESFEELAAGSDATDGFDGIDGGSDLDGGESDTGFDGFDDGSDFGGLDDDSEDSNGPIDVDDIDDDLVINGVPVGEMESLDEVNESLQGRINGTVRINGIPIGEGDNETSAETGAATNETVDRSNRTNRSDGDVTAGSGGDDTVETPTVGDGGTAEDETAESDGGGDGNETATVGDDIHISDESRDEAREILDELREERAAVVEVLDQRATVDSDDVRRESEATRQLLDEISDLLDAAEESVNVGVGTAAETLVTIRSKLDDRIAALEATGADVDGDDSGFLD